jgi:chaperonin cofactor prefoldin
MIVLILISFLVESGYKNRAGVDVQYAGYIWTLIGVGTILLSFSGKEMDARLLDIFLYGAGLAVLTSILGWTIGGWLENREQGHYADTTHAAADDLARAMLQVKKKFETAGTALTEAMEGAVGEIGKLRTESEKVNQILRDLSASLQASAESLNDSLSTTKGKFEAVGANADGLLIAVKTSVKQFDTLATQTQTAATNIKEVETNISKMATAVKNAATQSQDVIVQTGRFIEVVFDGKTKERAK